MSGWPHPPSLRDRLAASRTRAVRSRTAISRSPFAARAAGRQSRSVADAFEAFVRSRYSRAPLSREGLDEVTGFVHLKDVAVRLKTEPDRPLREIARPILRIPRTRGALELLREMQLTLTHMAVVLDEFGVTVGLVTAAGAWLRATTASRRVDTLEQLGDGPAPTQNRAV